MALYKIMLKQLISTNYSHFINGLVIIVRVPSIKIPVFFAQLRPEIEWHRIYNNHPFFLAFHRKFVFRYKYGWRTIMLTYILTGYFAYESYNAELTTALTRNMFLFITKLVNDLQKLKMLK